MEVFSVPSFVPAVAWDNPFTGPSGDPEVWLKPRPILGRSPSLAAMPPVAIHSSPEQVGGVVVVLCTGGPADPEAFFSWK